MSDLDDLNIRSILWVESMDDILYVVHDFAADSKGKNARLPHSPLSVMENSYGVVIRW